MVEIINFDIYLALFFPHAGPYYDPADPAFYMELKKDNFTSPITGKDRVIAYWDGGLSVSVSISERMLDIIFEASTQYLGNHTKGLLGKGAIIFFQIGGP